MYDVRRGAAKAADGGAGAGAGAGGWDCVCDCGRVNAEPAGADAGGTWGNADAAVAVAEEPKRLRMSSTVVRDVWGGGEDVPGADGVIDEPNISRSRSSLF